MEKTEEQKIVAELRSRGLHPTAKQLKEAKEKRKKDKDYLDKQANLHKQVDEIFNTKKNKK